MARRILIITGDGGECYETLYAVHRLREAGHQPQIAAPTRKRPRSTNFSGDGSTSTAGPFSACTTSRSPASSTCPCP